MYSVARSGFLCSHSQPVTDVTGVGIRSPFLMPTAASFLSAAKEKRKRNAAKNYVFGFPYAASRGFYPAKISHANIVPRKFHLNIALSLLLGALPLLL